MTEQQSQRSQEIKLDGHLHILNEFLYIDANGACKWQQDEDHGHVCVKKVVAAEDALPARMMNQTVEQNEEEEEKDDEQIDRIMDEIENHESDYES